uniref:Cathepsin propeptide inhibitor domain-containing protein n=1 Tax=Setaria viridis TaxID=4556 RepID=A0A4U6W231_SETVI|nr:uncharacterized protein LOC117842538 [Setaria viridis]TKW35363.1 hypothetical protein SEVIR_2G366100v2 [Setaria viridis]
MRGGGSNRSPTRYLDPPPLIKPMAPMASMVARVAHHASARSASLAARSGNACKDLILGSRSNPAVRPQGKLTGDVSPKRPIQLFGCAHHDARRRYTHSFHQVNCVADLQHEFVAQEKDMESDEAMWALYQRWCEHFKIERDHDDMIRRFPGSRTVYCKCIK